MPSIDTSSRTYELLSLTAICGEFPTHQLHRLSGGDSYMHSLVTTLKQKGLLLTHYRNGLRGFRLTKRAKEMLCHDNPTRYTFYLTGNCDTNRVRSDVVRRLRLHRMAEVYVTMKNGGVSIFRDLSPPIFSPTPSVCTITAPAYYDSRCVKEVGTSFVKIQNARSVGVLLTVTDIFVVYNMGDSLMRWSYKAEMRTKALLNTLLCRERMAHQYTPDVIRGLLFGNSMGLVYEILTNSSKQHFLLDGSFDSFYYLTNDRYGETVLKLLCSADLISQLDAILCSDLLPAQAGLPIEHDAMTTGGQPVLFAYSCDLPRIVRFHTAIQLQNKSGVLICFDYQADVLRRYCSKQVVIKTIDFDKWERRFFTSPKEN